MSWYVVKVDVEAADRSSRAFAWILVLAVGFWVIAAAALLWGVTR